MENNSIHDALKNVLVSKETLLKNAGVTASFIGGKLHGSYGFNLDSSKYVGAIMYWPEDKFEFQFNSCESGEVIILETKKFQSKVELESFIEDLFMNKLI